MTEEEQKAIEDIKNIVADLEDAESGAVIALQQDEIDSLKVIAELIDKQQKEIEEFRGIKNGTTIIYKCKAKYIREDKINKYYISKNKVREKIREVSNGTYDAKTILEQLLEE